MSSQIDIINQIKTYCSQKSTGALFLKLKIGKLLQIFFENGQIKSIKCQGESGMSVLNQVSSMVALKSQFYEDAISRIDDKLPTTSTIINMLVDHSSKTSLPSAPIPISDEQKETIKTIFTEYVGPIADIIFDEQVLGSVSCKDLIKNLYLQMEDINDQTAFQEDVENALK